MLTVASVIAIVYGTAFMGLGVVCAGTMSRSKRIPVGAAAAVVFVSLVVGPICLIAGAGLIWAGIELLDGTAWAVSVVRYTFWTVLVLASLVVIRGAIGLLQYWHIHRVLRGGLFFLLTGVPAIAVLLLLR